MVRNSTSSDTGISKRALPEGEDSDRQTTLSPSVSDGQTWTSPCPTGALTPSVSSCRAKVHSTTSPLPPTPVWNAVVTAYGSAASYDRPALTGSDEAPGTTSRSWNSLRTVTGRAAMRDSLGWGA